MLPWAAGSGATPVPERIREEDRWGPRRSIDDTLDSLAGVKIWDGF